MRLVAKWFVKCLLALFGDLRHILVLICVFDKLTKLTEGRKKEMPGSRKCGVYKICGRVSLSFV